MKKVLLTGATGLIGRETVKTLIAAGFSVYAFRRGAVNGAEEEREVTWLDGDLFSPTSIEKVCAAARAEYLLNLAWCATGDYQTSNLNYDYVIAGLQLLQNFHRCGGRRAIYVGTGFEYAPQNAALSETAPLAPRTPYEQCKHHLHLLAASYSAQNALSFGWGRIFFVYGIGENVRRLGGKLLHNFRAGQPVAIPQKSLRRDYLYTKDLAGALTAFLDSEVTGAVNLCRGEALTLEAFARPYAELLGAEKLLQLDDLPGDPPLILGDNTRLRQEVGYRPQYSHYDAVREIVAAPEVRL